MDRAPDIIMFVGAGFYPTADDFIKEALTLGCSKRVPSLPADIIPGQSRVFLAHDDGKTGRGFIFGFFTISGVDIILDDEFRIKQYQEKYQSLNIHGVSSTQVAQEPERRCGHRVYGSAYLVSENDMTKVWESTLPIAEKTDIKGGLVILLGRIPYPRIRFRGWRYMEPQFLAKYEWPQRVMPVKRQVKIEHTGLTKPLPLLEMLKRQRNA